MDLKIEGSGIKTKPFSRGGRILTTVEVEDVDNIDDIAAAIADKCDPAYLVTSNNTDGILDCIGKDYVKDYFGRVKADD